MTYPLSRIDLQRGANVAVISATCDRHMSSADGAKLTLGQVAELCHLVLASRSGRNPGQIRDRLIAVAVEWDLDTDLLRDQSDACIHEFAELLREAA